MARKSGAPSDHSTYSTYGQDLKKVLTTCRGELAIVTLAGAVVAAHANELVTLVVMLQANEYSEVYFDVSHAQVKEGGMIALLKVQERGAKLIC